MNLKEIILSLFPSLYIRKHFYWSGKADLRNFASFQIEPELLLLSHFLKADQVFVDVGSNKGAFIHAASAIVPMDQIVGVEPNPMLFRKLKAVFPSARIHDCALSSVEGEAVLAIPFTQNVPDDSLGHLESAASQNNAYNFKVQVKTLDTLTKDLPPIGLIKIDVEGREKQVLMGATLTLGNHRPVLLIEIESRHHQSPLIKLISEIASEFDCSAFYFDPKLLQLKEYRAESFSDQQMKDIGTPLYINNFFFLPNEKEPSVWVNQINKILASRN